jgi:hypothetical protein
MTKPLDQAIDAVRDLPLRCKMTSRAIMMMIGKDEPVVEMPAEEEASFAESRAQAQRRDFASDERMRAIWSKDL